MDTDKSETTLTERMCCLDRTLAARSCTHIDMEMRLAMSTSSDMNSRSPEVLFSFSDACAPDSFSVVRRRSASSLRNAENEDGSADRTTERARTMPMSSSSDRWASCAASSSSFAMPKDTEKARSEPSELSAPAVLMPPPRPPVGACQTVRTEALKQISRECEVLRHLLAWQEGLTLTIRHLLVSPILTTDTPGRGGKSFRRKVVSGGHEHSYSSSVFGCMLSHLVGFAMGKKRRSVASTMHALRKTLEPATRALCSSRGVDAEYLKCGFACCTVIRGQVLAISGGQRAPRINTRLGKSSVAIGLGVALFFLFSISSELRSEAAALRVATDFWTEWCVRVLDKWKVSGSCMAPAHQEALDAERRSLQRGLLAIRVAKKRAAFLQLSTHTAARLEVAFMSKAMWPANCAIDEAAHAQLCAWIRSEDFLEEAPPVQLSLASVGPHSPTPLSALHELPETSYSASDSDSLCDSSSSAGWSSSAGSDGGNDVFSADLLQTLATNLNRSVSVELYTRTCDSRRHCQ